jgi:hypothetical protein
MRWLAGVVLQQWCGRVVLSGSPADNGRGRSFLQREGCVRGSSRPVCSGASLCVPRSRLFHWRRSFLWRAALAQHVRSQPLGAGRDVARDGGEDARDTDTHTPHTHAHTHTPSTSPRARALCTSWLLSPGVRTCVCVEKGGHCQGGPPPRRFLALGQRGMHAKMPRGTVRCSSCTAHIAPLIHPTFRTDSRAAIPFQPTRHTVAPWLPCRLRWR